MTKKKTIETLLNELFSLDKEDNEKKSNNTIPTETLTYNKQLPFSESARIVYLLLLALDKEDKMLRKKVFTTIVFSEKTTEQKLSSTETTEKYV